MAIDLASKSLRLGKRSKCIASIESIPQLTDQEVKYLKRVTEKYPFRANGYYLGLIDWDDPDDPIRRLIIPNVAELNGWSDLDPSNERAITVGRGIQHKYSTTALVLTTEACGCLCRYCFRKRLFMEDNDEGRPDIDSAIEYIRTHSEIDNVLLSGGDPLVLSTSRLDGILTELREIEHVGVIRIGSKMPAFDPYRIIEDPGLLEMLKRHSHTDKRIYLVCHFDHPRELTEESREAIRLVQECGVICLNQNPIIRGISDEPETMAELWKELTSIGVAQYYVFQIRPTAGNESYHVPIAEAYFRFEKAKAMCSGIAKRVRFVMSHATGKVEIIAVDDNYIYIKYHRSKDPVDDYRIRIFHRDDNAYWLDNLDEVTPS